MKTLSIITLLFIILLTSCKSKELKKPEMVQNDLKTSFVTKLQDITSSFFKSKEERAAEKLYNDLKSSVVAKLQDSTSTLDSFKLEEVDTVTQKKLLIEQSNYLSDQLPHMYKIHGIHVKLLLNRADGIKILKSIDYKQQAEQELREYQKEKAHLDYLGKEFDKIIATIKSLKSNVQQADSIIPIGFHTVCSYKLILKNKSIKRDTAYITLNKNGDIVDYFDFLKLPYKINYKEFEKIQ